MAKFKSLVNKKFGTLLVMRRVEDKIYNNCNYKYNSIKVQYECQCDCGKILIRSANYLKAKQVPSCSDKCRYTHKVPNLAGIKFNNIEVLQLADIKKYGSYYWDCKCTCGEVIQLNTSKILKQSVKKCNMCASVENINNYNMLDKKATNRLPDGEAGFNALFSRYKKNAKNRNLPFELNEQEFRVLTKSNCHYCGIEPSQKIPSDNALLYSLNNKKGMTSQYIYTGIDRIDPNVGYIEGNITPCCHICNYMKQDMQKDEFLNKIKHIYLFNIDKP